MILGEPNLQFIDIYVRVSRIAIVISMKDTITAALDYYIAAL